MTKYEIKKFVSMDYTFYLIRNTETDKFFAGYDFMGSQEWTNSLCAYEMDYQEALAILADLEAADADDQPEDEREEETMKYTVYSADQYTKVGETNSELEALKMRDQFMDSNPQSDCVIEDQDGNLFDDYFELASFVDSMMKANEAELKPMTDKEALRTLMQWFKADVCIPEDMSAEILAYYWNSFLKDMEAKKAAEIEAQDDKIAASIPECLRFRKAYKDGSSAFFDPDRLDNDLIRTGYDEVHREIIIKALKAYLK